MKRCTNKKRRICMYVAAVFLLIAALLLGLMLGAVSIPFKDMINAIGDTDSPEARILLYVRLPRILACVFCGAALAVSGAVIQNVLANRLASPGIIGVNAGAGLAVTVCSAFGILGGWIFTLSSFVGAFAAVTAVSLGAKRWGASRGTVILLGVAVNSLMGAVSEAIITFMPEAGVISRDFKVGDFSYVTYEKLIPAAVVITVTVIILLTFTNDLSVLTLGEDNARGFGLDTGKMRPIFLVLAALLAGAAVSLAGLLSFVGLLVPHAVKRIGASSSDLIPLCALFGGGFVALCDTLARTVFAPYEIPVGIIMAFIGAPFFVFILIKRREGGTNA